MKGLDFFTNESSYETCGVAKLLGGIACTVMPSSRIKDYDPLSAWPSNVHRQLTVGRDGYPTVRVLAHSFRGVGFFIDRQLNINI